VCVCRTILFSRRGLDAGKVISFWFDREKKKKNVQREYITNHFLSFLSKLVNPSIINHHFLSLKKKKNQQKQIKKKKQSTDFLVRRTRPLKRLWMMANAKKLKKQKNKKTKIIIKIKVLPLSLEFDPIC
jgi:hypothetical protein